MFGQAGKGVVMSDEEKNAAIEYWQNDIAKFFVSSNGPTQIEILMFKAGIKYEKNRIENFMENNDQRRSTRSFIKSNHKK